jgi:hypothetical protein
LRLTGTPSPLWPLAEIVDSLHVATRIAVQELLQ